MFHSLTSFAVLNQQVPQTPTEDLKGNASLQKTLMLMTKQPKSADDYVKSAFRKVLSKT